MATGPARADTTTTRLVASEASRCLPVFSQPVEGAPQSLPTWDGTSVEIAGVAAAAKIPPAAIALIYGLAISTGAPDGAKEICS